MTTSEQVLEQINQNNLIMAKMSYVMLHVLIVLYTLLACALVAIAVWLVYDYITKLTSGDSDG